MCGGLKEYTSLRSCHDLACFCTLFPSAFSGFILILFLLWQTELFDGLISLPVSKFTLLHYSQSLVWLLSSGLLAVVLTANKQTCWKDVKASWTRDKPVNRQWGSKTKINIGSLFAKHRLMSKVNKCLRLLDVSAVGYFHFVNWILTIWFESM